MRDFANGNRLQYEALDRTLADHMCHVFDGCQLPDGCVPNVSRIGFERTENSEYIIYVDRGISADTSHQEFNSFITTGEIHFNTLSELITFMVSLRPLFEEYEHLPLAYENMTDSQTSAYALEPVYDADAVSAIREAETRKEPVWPEDLSENIKKNIYGQDKAVDEIAKKVALNRMNNNPSLVSLMLLGATGTGKSETGRMLAKACTECYGEHYGFIEIAANEFVGEHTVHRLFGAPPGYVGHGEKTMLEPIRDNPDHVIVVNEIEKADKKVFVGWMEAIDTGFLKMADNTAPIDLRKCIILFTSNLHTEYKKFAEMSRFERNETCRDLVTEFYGGPEIAARVGSYIVFEELSDEAKMDIVAKFAKKAVREYGMTLEYIDDDLMADFMRYQTKYGARPIKDLVRDSIEDLIMRKRDMKAGHANKVRLSGKVKSISVETKG